MEVGSTMGSTDLKEKAKARLRELAPLGQMEPGGGIHATLPSPFLACLYRIDLVNLSTFTIQMPPISIVIVISDLL